MAPISHRLAADKYKNRHKDLEGCGLFAAGDLRGFAYPYAGGKHGPLPAIPIESGYFPSPSASLGWSASNDQFLLSQIAFRVPFFMVKDYVTWMNIIVPGHHGLFDYLGITISLEIYAHDHVPRDYHNVVPLLSLWNRDSHTFISKFHEFTGLD